MRLQGCISNTLQHAQSLSLFRLLCSPMGCSLPGSSVHEILQARILEWVAISFSGGSSKPRDRPPSLASPALAGGFLTAELPGEPLQCIILNERSQTQKGHTWTTWFHLGDIPEEGKTIRTRIWSMVVMGWRGAWGLGLQGLFCTHGFVLYLDSGDGGYMTEQICQRLFNNIERG